MAQFRFHPNETVDLGASTSVKPSKQKKKFKVLKFNQNFMARIGINSHHLTESKNEFFRSFAAYFILFNLIVLCIISSSVFAYQNLNHLELALLTTLVIVAGFQSSGMFLSVGLNMTTVKTLHLQLQNIVNNGKRLPDEFLRKRISLSISYHFFHLEFAGYQVDNDEIFNLYWTNEQKCRKHSKRACLYIYFNQAAFVAAFIFSIIMLLNGQFDSSKLELPFNMAVPFDTTTPHGWYALWLCQFR